MSTLGATTAALARMRRDMARATTPSSANVVLRETASFGSNPGALRMLSYAPSDLDAGAPLVVVLHGCTQNADGYVRGAGWATLADRYGFVVLAPEQTTANNGNRCFDWWQPEDVLRGRGEVASIRQMIERATKDHQVDRSRVFITGLSAGGAMTAAMLASYPEVFAGGAIIAGLPFGAAETLQQALGSMFQCRPRPAAEWGDLVRGASPHRGPWPRVSVWHGGADATVIPQNALETVKQWTNVHGVTDASGRSEIADGRSRRVWRDAKGDAVVEYHALPWLGHGTPVAAAEGLGTVEAYFLEAGVSSTLEIARFWNIDQERMPSARRIPSTRAAPPPTPDRPKPTLVTGFDIEGVIHGALRSAGLMPRR